MTNNLEDLEKIENLVFYQLNSLKLKYEKNSVRRGSSGVEYNFDVIVKVGDSEVALDIAVGREDEVTAHLAAFIVAIKDCNIKGLFITDVELGNVDKLLPGVRIVNIRPEMGLKNAYLQFKYNLELLTRK